MKNILFGALLFFLGGVAGLWLCRYVSPVWSYNESIGIREMLVDASISYYRAGRVPEAAVLMKEANQVASRMDATWPFFFPWNGAMLRVTGAFSGVHVSRDYRAPETAYLFRAAGLEEEARPYYERLQKERGRTPAQIDASAEAFIREAAAFQEQGQSHKLPSLNETTR